MIDRTRLRRRLPDRVLLGVGLAITLGAVACREAAEDPAGGKLAGLPDYIHASMADWDLPGLAVAVVHGDEVVFAEGFGVRELGREEPVDAHTLFQIGSVSKSFAAAAIGALVDDGLVHWDDPVVAHLPWFRVKDPEITREMTIRDLLSHQSGMPGDAFPTLAIMDARTAAERARYLDNQAPLRESFRYSNQGYGVAGLLVEAVTGRTWGEWVRERLFQPLEMHNSAASPYEVWEEPFVAPAFFGTAPAGTVGIGHAPGRNVAMPHGVDREGMRRVLAWQSFDSMQAAGSVVSSAAEMANWVRMHLARGRFGDRAVLGEATVEEMHASQVASGATFLFADDTSNGTYALGWSRATFEGHPYLSHGGGILGFPAYVALLPNISAGVVVLANGDAWFHPHHEISAWVFARLLGREPRDWHGEAMAHKTAIVAQIDRTLAAQDSARVPATRPTLPLDEYVGRYAEPLGAGYAEVLLAQDGRLRLRFGEPGTFSGDMEHWNDDVFRLRYDGGDGQIDRSSFVTFTLEPEVGVTIMDLGSWGQYRRREG